MYGVYKKVLRVLGTGVEIKNYVQGSPKPLSVTREKWEEVALLCPGFDGWPEWFLPVVNKELDRPWHIKKDVSLESEFRHSRQIVSHWECEYTHEFYEYRLAYYVSELLKLHSDSVGVPTLEEERSFEEIKRNLRILPVCHARVQRILRANPNDATVEHSAYGIYQRQRPDNFDHLSRLFDIIPDLISSYEDDLNARFVDVHASSFSELLTRLEVVVKGKTLPTLVEIKDKSFSLKSDSQLRSDLSVVGPVDYVVPRSSFVWSIAEAVNSSFLYNVWLPEHPDEIGFEQQEDYFYTLDKFDQSKICTLDVVPRGYGPLLGPEVPIVLTNKIREFSCSDIDMKILSYLPRARKTCHALLQHPLDLSKKRIIDFIASTRYCLHNIGTTESCPLCPKIGHLDLSSLNILAYTGDWKTTSFFDACRLWVRRNSPIFTFPRTFGDPVFIDPGASKEAFASLTLPHRRLFALALRDMFPMFRYQNEYVVGLIRIITGVNLLELSRSYVPLCRARSSVNSAFSPSHRAVIFYGKLITKFSCSHEATTYFWNDQSGRWIRDYGDDQVVSVSGPVGSPFSLDKMVEDPNLTQGDKILFSGGCSCCARDLLPRGRVLV